ncbi:MAG TPA: phage tail tube protein [Candidatus Bathyarchaeia archaeon]|nr:phage tail tube protein [Candidatus Bathyarchaeia archaeon]
MAATRYVGLGKETTYGTAVAATRYGETIASLKPDQNWKIPKPVAYRAFMKKYLGPYRARGAIGDFAVEPENLIGELLLGVFGSVATTNPSTGVYLHTFTPADTLPSYTIRQGSEQTERILPGGLVDALTVHFAHDEVIKAKADVLSGFVETKASLGTPTFTALQALSMQEASSVLTIAGATKRSTIYDLEVSVKNNIPFDKGTLDGRTFSKKLVGMREVTGKLSAYFDSTDEYDKFIAGTEFTLIIQADGPIISGAYKYFLAFELRKCVFKGAVPDLKAWDEPLVVDAPFQAFYDTNGGFNAEAKAKLENAITAY